jgi:hypothetical protein
MPLSIRATSSRSSVRGATPMPTTTAAQSIVPPSASRTRSARPAPSIASTPAPNRRSTPCSLWDVAVEGAELGTEDAQQRQLERLDERDVHALLARGGGDLAADPAAADHHQPAASVEGRADRVRVLDGAQEEHAVEVAAGHGKTARLTAGREQQAAVVEPLAARQDDGLPPASIDWTTLEVRSSTSLAAYQPSSSCSQAGCSLSPRR